MSGRSLASVSRISGGRKECLVVDFVVKIVVNGQIAAGLAAFAIGAGVLAGHSVQAMV